MRLVSDRAELIRLLEALPEGLRNPNAQWNEVLGASFRLRRDLLYFDLIHFPMIAKWPAILAEMEEERCFVFNVDKLYSSNAEGTFAFEIAPQSDENRIKRDLSTRDDFRPAFYLVRRFCIVTPSLDWIILAEPDERAFVTSDHELKYSLFNKLWWSYSEDTRD